MHGSDFPNTDSCKFVDPYTSSRSVIRDRDHYKLFYGARVDMVHKYFAIGMATHPAPLTSK